MQQNTSPLVLSLTCLYGWDHIKMVILVGLGFLSFESKALALEEVTFLLVS
jgi:hypothetical protein